uniref:Sushi domain-containing protein n=1 Tax=Magallana gigas TaxID=29159 RepID=A0A8W8KPA4_MAGGI
MTVMRMTRGNHNPEYDLLDQPEDVEDYHHSSYILRSDAPPEEKRLFLVSDSCLASILGKYYLCEEPYETVVQFTRGTMIGTVSTCRNGHITQWESQKCQHGMSWFQPSPGCQPILCQQLCLPDFHQAELLNQYEGRTLTLGSDARCDSPGFSAKFGSYTYGLGDREKCNEVAGSTHMELKGLKRGLQ